MVNIVDPFEALSQYSSWADIKQDGLANQADLNLIKQSLGPCRAPTRD